MLCDPRRSNISRIEREAGVKFEHITAPQPEDIAKAVGVEAAETITQISDRYTCYSCCFMDCWGAFSFRFLDIANIAV